MTSIPVNLAVEDRLSEAVLRRILSHVDRGFTIGAAYNRGGYGYLKRTVRGWNRAAAGVSFVLLTDLDNRYDCPPALISDWLSEPLHPNLAYVTRCEGYASSTRCGIGPSLLPSSR